jgi:hypothetical protein
MLGADECSLDSAGLGETEGIVQGGRNLRKTAAVKSGDPATEKNRADGTKPREQDEPSGLEGFKNDPVKGAQAILRLRSKEKIDLVLSNADFAAGLRKLASDAAAAPKAAVALSKFALRPEFSSAAAAAVESAGAWTEPAKFGADDRRLAADALERLRPAWSLPWLVKALAAASERDSYAALRRYFASRLLLVSGGLLGTVEALAKMTVSGLKPKAQFSLIRELRDCARPAPGDGERHPVIAFAQSVSKASGPDGAQLKQEVARLLCEAASADRGLLLDDTFVGAVTALDAASGMKLREDAAKLGGAGRPPAPEPRGDDVPRRDQTTLLREAAWSEADVTLGRALRDMGALDRSFKRLESVVDGEAAERTRRARNASNLVLQWVEQAAHKRSIKALNRVGELVPFDPALHDDLGEDVATGDHVRVVKPSIVRGDGAQQVVLVRGEVELE